MENINKLYCVRFSAGECGVGYIRPYNAVRNEDIYSCTYIVPSMIDGMEDLLECKGKILRHKLQFSGQESELVRFEEKPYREATICTIHQLTNPVVILGFENKEDAENASKKTIYLGQRQYILFPTNFDGDDGIVNDDIVVEKTEEEFSNIVGTETFQTTKENGLYCGNNRYRNNERMYIRIVRTHE